MKCEGYRIDVADVIPNVKGGNVEQAQLETFRQHFSGDIILPEDEGYETARSSYMRKGSPAAVVRPLNSADVALAVGLAKDNGLLLSVRSGGHSGVGHSTIDGGLVIDLSKMNDVTVVDSVTHRVKIGSGAVWGDVAGILGKQGLALSSGDTKSVGVGGLTLGGGIGWMVRKYGLALDSVVAAEIVTANGDVLQLSDDENPHLFWAIRGGGGNFGVVTSFEFIAHPLGKVFAGRVIYKLEKIDELLRGWRDCMRQASENLNTTMLLMPSFDGSPPVATMLAVYAGDDEKEAMSAIEPLLHIGTVVSKDIQKKAYADVLEEAHAPQGMRIIVNNTFVKTFSDELAATLAALYDQDPKPLFMIRSLGEGLKHVDHDATAFVHRDSEALIITASFVPPGTNQAGIEKALKSWKAIAPFGSGSYVNFFNDATQKEIDACYPKATYERLAEIKAAYDPDNIFSQTFNIKPARK